MSMPTEDELKEVDGVDETEELTAETPMDTSATKETTKEPEAAAPKEEPKENADVPKKADVQHGGDARKLDLGKTAMVCNLPSSFLSDTYDVFSECLTEMLKEDFGVQRETIDKIIRIGLQKEPEHADSALRALVSFKIRAHKHRLLAQKRLTADSILAVNAVEQLPEDCIIEEPAPAADSAVAATATAEPVQAKKEPERPTYEDEDKLAPFEVNWDGAPEFQWKLCSSSADTRRLTIDNLLPRDLDDVFIYRTMARAEHADTSFPSRVNVENRVVYGKMTLTFNTTRTAVVEAMHHLVYTRSANKRRLKVYLPQTPAAQKLKTDFEERLGRVIKPTLRMHQLIIKILPAGVEATLENAKAWFPNSPVVACEEVKDEFGNRCAQITMSTATDANIAHKDNQFIVVKTEMTAEEIKELEKRENEKKEKKAEREKKEGTTKKEESEKKAEVEKKEETVKKEETEKKEEEVKAVDGEKTADDKEAVKENGDVVKVEEKSGEEKKEENATNGTESEKPVEPRFKEHRLKVLLKGVECHFGSLLTHLDITKERNKRRHTDSSSTNGGSAAKKPKSVTPGKAILASRGAGSRGSGGGSRSTPSRGTAHVRPSGQSGGPNRGAFGRGRGGGPMRGGGSGGGGMRGGSRGGPVNRDRFAPRGRSHVQQGPSGHRNSNGSADRFKRPQQSAAFGRGSGGRGRRDSGNYGYDTPSPRNSGFSQQRSDTWTSGSAWGAGSTNPDIAAMQLRDIEMKEMGRRQQQMMDSMSYGQNDRLSRSAFETTFDAFGNAVPTPSTYGGYASSGVGGGYGLASDNAYIDRRRSGGF